MKMKATKEKTVTVETVWNLEDLGLSKCKQNDVKMKATRKKMETVATEKERNEWKIARRWI